MELAEKFEKSDSLFLKVFTLFVTIKVVGITVGVA